MKINIKDIKLSFLDKNSFITTSFCITLACIVLYFIGSYNIVWTVSALILLVLNYVLSICCWIRKKHSPYRTALFAVNSAVLILLGVFFLYTTPINFNDIFEKQLHLKVWDWIAFILGGLTLIFAACTWSSQEKTQQNTLQITPDGQYRLLEDSVRDAYRNLSLIYALSERMKGLEGLYYPSDEIILRMCADDRFIYPSLFADDPNKCRQLQRYRINIRNANIEYKVIADRFKDADVNKEIHVDDIRFIKARMESNLQRLYDLLISLWGYDVNMAEGLRAYIKKNAADSNKEKDEYKELFAEADKKFDSGELEYFYTGIDEKGERTKFMKLLFPEGGGEEESEFLRTFNKNIYADAHLYGRIRLIPYDPSRPLILS